MRIYNYPQFTRSIEQIENAAKQCAVNEHDGESAVTGMDTRKAPETEEKEAGSPEKEKNQEKTGRSKKKASV